MTYLQAAILGIVQGLTEFLPISSTAHLLIGGQLLGHDDPGGVFTVMIQLGAVLAVMWLYRERILTVATGLLSQPDARRFTIMLLVAALQHAVRESDPEMAAELARVLVHPHDADATKLRPHRAWAEVFERVVLDRRGAGDGTRDSRFDDNYAFFRSEELDRVLDAARLEQDRARRLAAYARAEEIVRDEAPWVPLYAARVYQLWQPHVRGQERAAPLGPWLHEVWLAGPSDGASTATRPPGAPPGPL